MKTVKIKIALILLMLIPLPFSCMEECLNLDLYAEPYWRMMGLTFNSAELYFINQASQKPMPMKVSQEYDTHVYPCDSLALYFVVPDSMLLFHSQNNSYFKNGFSFTQTAFAACENDRPGYMGTLDKVDKIFIYSKYDFDETHLAGWDMSDIVDILAYTIDEDSGGGFWQLNEYNASAPHIAPKRFYLLIKRKARLSDLQQFVISYYLTRQNGQKTEFRVETPLLKVRVAGR